MNRVRRPVVAVIGPSEARDVDLQRAEAVGERLARAGIVVATGGLGGVMTAALRGAKRAGSPSGDAPPTLAILPTDDPCTANAFADIAIACGNGQQRNCILVQSAGCVLAIGGAMGTLSEIALALRAGRAVIALDSWNLPGLEDPRLLRVRDADEAVRATLRELRIGRAPPPLPTPDQGEPP